MDTETYEDGYALANSLDAKGFTVDDLIIKEYFIVVQIPLDDGTEEFATEFLTEERSWTLDKRTFEAERYSGLQLTFVL